MCSFHCLGWQQIWERGEKSQNCEGFDLASLSGRNVKLCRILFSVMMWWQLIFLGCLLLWAASAKCDKIKIMMIIKLPSVHTRCYFPFRSTFSPISTFPHSVWLYFPASSSSPARCREPAGSKPTPKSGINLQAPRPRPHHRPQVGPGPICWHVCTASPTLHCEDSSIYNLLAAAHRPLGMGWLKQFNADKRCETSIWQGYWFTEHFWSFWDKFICKRLRYFLQPLGRHLNLRLFSTSRHESKQCAECFECLGNVISTVLWSKAAY